MRLFLGVSAALLALALLAGVTTRGKRSDDVRPRGRLILEGLALLAVFVLVVVVIVALRAT
jgi:hypothetical protein